MSHTFEIDEGYDVEVLQSGVHLRVPNGVIVKDFPYMDTGQRLVEKCEAAWSSHEDGPMNFRLVGPPGSGKNALVYHLAERRRQELFMVLGNEELTAEDLLVNATIQGDGSVAYVASPLVAAMLRGGICFIDEIAKMRPRSLAPLASLLDERRMVFSALLGQSIKAHSAFSLCAAYNPTDADAFDLPPWLKARTLPEFRLDPPPWDVLERIVVEHNSEWKELAVEVRARAKLLDLNLDPGQMLRIVSYASRIDRFRIEHELDLGDPVEVALQHIVEYTNE